MSSSVVEDEPSIVGSDIVPFKQGVAGSNPARLMGGKGHMRCPFTDSGSSVGLAGWCRTERPWSSRTETGRLDCAGTRIMWIRELGDDVRHCGRGRCEEECTKRRERGIVPP